MHVGALVLVCTGYDLPRSASSMQRKNCFDLGHNGTATCVCNILHIMSYYVLLYSKYIYIHIHINYACSKYSLRSLSLYWSTQYTRFQSFMNLCEAFESPDNYLVLFLKLRAWQVDLQWSWQRLAWRIILLIIFKLAWLLAWASSILEHGGFEA